MWTAFTCTIHAEHTRNKFHRMLSIRGTDFIACWACTEMFKSRISRPNRIRFSKNSCYRPLGPYGFGFCKNSIKNIYACVPLRLDNAGKFPLFRWRGNPWTAGGSLVKLLYAANEMRIACFIRNNMAPL
jgi:hypothetical protein